jgi:fumarate reductase subunit C
MTVQPGPEKVAEGEARVVELTAFLQHPSFRFLNELHLAGPLAHAKCWLEVLPRYAPPGLKRITTAAITATDAVAVDLAFRFPRWTWVWGTASSSSSFLRRLFGG